MPATADGTGLRARGPTFRPQNLAAGVCLRFDPIATPLRGHSRGGGIVNMKESDKPSRQERRWQQRERQKQRTANPNPLHAKSLAVGEVQQAGIRAWHLAIGIPASFFALGLSLAFSGPSYFWYGMMLTYFGIIWLFVDWFIYSRKLTGLTKVIGALAPLALAAIVTLVAFWPAPLGIVIIADDLAYEKDADVYGVKWKDNYFPVTILVNNPSKRQYLDVQIIERTNLFIAGVGSNLRERCSYAPYAPGLAMASATMTYTDTHGKSITEPLELQIRSLYRITCDKLLPNETIEIRTAVISGLLDSAKREKPSWVMVKVEYVSAGRPEVETSEQPCLIDRCDNLPRDIEFVEYVPTLQ